MIEFVSDNTQGLNLKVVGVGGAGVNVLESLSVKMGDIEMMALDTDVQALKSCRLKSKVQLGEKLTRGLGSGEDPEIGKRAVHEVKKELEKCFSGTELVVIISGLGGGTGSGSSVIVADICKKMGALVIGIVTKPFAFEGRVRQNHAHNAVMNLKEYTDTLVVISNQDLIQLMDNEISYLDAFKISEKFLSQGFYSIISLITAPGLINLDLGTLKSVLYGAGIAGIGIGQSRGSGRAAKAVDMAVSSPLWGDVKLAGAKRILINIAGGRDLTVDEINRITSVIYNMINHNAHVSFGAVMDPALEGEVRVSILAMGRVSLGKAIHPVADKKKKGFQNSYPVNLEAKKWLDMAPKRQFLGSVSFEDELDIPTFIRRGEGM
jgi:cell division protein FtsZ